MGLFLASVIMPSQWPRFFSRERSEKLAAALSDVNKTCEVMERDLLKLYGNNYNQQNIQEPSKRTVLPQRLALIFL